MCLILFAYRPQAARPLVVAANRDEFYSRPAQAAHWWRDAPNVFGGRDRVALGTWLAVGRNGRLAAVTNWTEQGKSDGKRSRGELPCAFLRGNASAAAFVNHIDGAQYAGFNFLAYDGELLVYGSNRIDKARVLAPGVYGLTNTRLAPQTDPADDWPKATAGARALRAIAAVATVDQLLALLATPLAPEQGPGTSESPENRHLPAFIRGTEYGTRASTAVVFRRDSARFAERQYGPRGQPGRRTDATIAFQPAQGAA